MPSRWHSAARRTWAGRPIPATVRSVPRRLVLLVAAAVLAGCGSSRAKVEVAPQPARAFAGSGLAHARPAPPIALRDAGGHPVTLAAQRGRYVLVTFLYTHCLDVCPLIASNLDAALRLLGPARAHVRVLAVSVDPKGDTAPAVRAYARRMHLLPEFRYLIGTRPELRRAWAAWHVLSIQRQPGLVDHVAYTALVDPAGDERVLYDSGVRAGQVVHDIRLLMRRG
jgi:protein SCO1